MDLVILSMSFEVERFEWAAEDRLELSGRWFGVGGRRFLRPTLELDVDGDTRRLLATLEHKPWAPDEGEEWIAAFEWLDAPAEKIERARLIVGPDSTVELAPPGSANGRRRPAGGGGRELAAARAEVKRVRAAFERERDAAVAERADLGAELDVVKGELEEARLRIDALESNLRVASRLRDEAREERNAALESREAAVAEREDALAQREAAVAERDRALAERDAAVAERDGALAELDAARAAAKTQPPAVPAAREAAPDNGRTVSPPERPMTLAAEPPSGPAFADRALADTAEARFRSYPIRPGGRASERVRWVARALAVLSLLLFVAAVITLIA